MSRIRYSRRESRRYFPASNTYTNFEFSQVKAVSSEEEVRVRVKVIDDQFTILYSQDIDIDGREGTFYVPAVITNTDSITVQVSTFSFSHRLR